MNKITRFVSTLSCSIVLAIFNSSFVLLRQANAQLGGEVLNCQGTVTLKFKPGITNIPTPQSVDIVGGSSSCTGVPLPLRVEGYNLYFPNGNPTLSCQTLNDISGIRGFYSFKFLIPYRFFQDFTSVSFLNDAYVLTGKIDTSDTQDKFLNGETLTQTITVANINEILGQCNNGQPVTQLDSATTITITP